MDLDSFRRRTAANGRRAARVAVLSAATLVAWVLLGSACSTPASAPDVAFPAGIDHAPWQRLLERYVDDRGLVDYDAWRRSDADAAALDRYLAAYEPAPEEPARGADRHAGLINLYNALTIRDVLRREPRKSYWDLDPFGERRHGVGGAEVSLDDVEHRAARPEIGYRVHSVLVCAAMSCPPLPRRAATADNLNGLLDERMRVWLADPALNAFDPSAGVVRVSKIFDWFGEDFRDPGLESVLAAYAPPKYREFLARGDYEIRYLDYDKSLNARR